MCEALRDIMPQRISLRRMDRLELLELADEMDLSRESSLNHLSRFRILLAVVRANKKALAALPSREL